MRPPTWIEPGRLLAGRHPCAWTPEDAPEEIRALLSQGVTLFLDLTEQGELEPYHALVPPSARWLRVPIRDFSVPSAEVVTMALDLIDAELEAGGIVYVHCWAGCGRTGVLVGCWLVRHGLDPREALARVADARGLGCPQTLEQRLAILGWGASR
jgi:protein-tyrosine phosphatase